MSEQIMSLFSSLAVMMFIIVLITTITHVILKITTEGLAMRKPVVEEPTSEETYLEAYSTIKQTLNYFKSYRKFYRKMNWFIFRNRKDYSKELSELFQVVTVSPYKDNTFYQYEVIQLFTKIKPKNLLKETTRQQLINQIQRLNETFWDIEF